MSKAIDFNSDWLGLVDSKNRNEKLNEPVAQKLFQSMPDKIVAAIERAFLANEIKGEDAERVWEYLKYESFIARAINRQAGSGQAYYYLYNKYAFGPIDQYFCDCAAGHQTFNRLLEIQKNIPAVLRENFSDQEKIVVYNVGSAQGYDMIGVLAEHSDLAEKCYVYNIDPDEVSLAQGWERIVSLGLEQCFTLIPQPLQEVPRRDVDFIVASGIFCPKPMRESLVVMKRVMMPHLREGGVIMYNATTTEMYMGDPLCDFLMRIAGWPMDYKTIEETVSIGTKSGMKNLGHFCDPMDYNCCVFAQK